ncbi:Achaete-scute transcription factor-related protein [Artemisia annua]|uniref:Achaete-scute transcription factor-related protein n=1 Tax=Artemisia annua TaxID=35608 RepID=A0A2U1N758_ARTAN|nr:Achaete-scute transcription factor-related protein [Artemisia annua]
MSSGISANSGGDGNLVVKKYDHNAGERDRRKRVNNLYQCLGSLLPVTGDQKKKQVSIPGIVSRAVKYLPELQKEVEALKLKKENILPFSSPIINSRQEGLAIKNQSGEGAITKRNSWLVSSVNVLGDKEVVIQLTTLTDRMSTNKENCFLSKVLENLENGEYGFVLLNATTMKCSGEGMVLSTLHLQVHIFIYFYECHVTLHTNKVLKKAN